MDQPQGLHHGLIELRQQLPIVRSHNVPYSSSDQSIQVRGWYSLSSYEDRQFWKILTGDAKEFIILSHRDAVNRPRTTN